MYSRLHADSAEVVDHNLGPKDPDLGDELEEDPQVVLDPRRLDRVLFMHRLKNVTPLTDGSPEDVYPTPTPSSVQTRVSGPTTPPSYRPTRTPLGG